MLFSNPDISPVLSVLESIVDGTAAGLAASAGLSSWLKSIRSSWAGWAGWAGVCLLSEDLFAPGLLSAALGGIGFAPSFVCPGRIGYIAKTWSVHFLASVLSLVHT